MDRNIASAHSLVIILMLITSALLVSCSDSEDKQQTGAATDALKNLDAENQKSREGQTIPNVAPQVTILAPSTGSSVTASPVEISWTATDQNGDKLGVDVQYRLIGAAASSDSYKPIMQFATPDPKKVSWDIASLAKGDYEVMVKVSDGSLSNVAFSRVKRE
ncbi:MAG: Ig-like domain-containing protein [Nanoarchaeota archaeon]